MTSRRPVWLTDEQLNELTILVHNERRRSDDPDWKELYRDLVAAPYVPVPWLTVDDNGNPVRMEPVSEDGLYEFLHCDVNNWGDDVDARIEYETGHQLYALAPVEDSENQRA